MYSDCPHCDTVNDRFLAISLVAKYEYPCDSRIKTAVYKVEAQFIIKKHRKFKKTILVCMIIYSFFKTGKEFCFVKFFPQSVTINLL